MAKDSKDDQNPPDIVDRFQKSLSDSFNRVKKTALGENSSAQRDFFHAVKNNRADAVLKLIEAGGVDLNACNSKGQRALHIAAVENAPEVVRLLISRGANPRLGKEHDPLHTPLEDAVIFERAEVAELLAAAGGYTPHRRVYGQPLLHRACAKGDPRIVEALLKAGADCNEEDENGSTPLLTAITYGRLGVVKSLLQLQKVLDVMHLHFIKTDEKKRTAFQLAADYCGPSIVSAMIEKGADVNGCNAEGKSPLICAVERNDAMLVRLLVENGADLNKTAAGRPTPLAHARATLDGAVRENMVALLIRLGADPGISPSPPFFKP